METKTFAELGLSAKVQQAITASGYTTPTPIQEQAIPVAMAGRDVLGIAQTGTGKTASFTLPMISRLETGRARARMPRSLILAPTRELAAQVAASFEKYGINHKLDVALLIGGVSMDEQSKKLDRGVDVLIATPGRLMDHFQRGRVMLMGVEILVIDEADRMLDMGFIPDIEKICKLLPPRKQTLFFSATMPAEITRLTQQFLVDPVRIEVAPPATSAKTITQAFAYCPTGEDWAKRETLRELLRGPGVRNAIIFCNRKVEVAILLKSLVKHGFNAGAIHGDMDQKSRMETLDKFRNGEIAFLVGSDVAARGLDIPDVSHVFNYDLPRDKDDYVHRIGRTGRAGKEGHSFSLVTPFDIKQLQELEKMSGEPAVWAGIAPTEQDYADAGKKKRGRTTGSVGSGSGRAGGGRERPMPQRGGPKAADRGSERRAPRDDAGTGSGESVRSGGGFPGATDGPRGTPRGAPRGGQRPGLTSQGRQRDDDQPARREVLNTGQRRPFRTDATKAPGLEPQPAITASPLQTGAKPPQGDQRAPQAGSRPPQAQQNQRQRSERGPERGGRDRSRNPAQSEGGAGGRGDGRGDSRRDSQAEGRTEPRSDSQAQTQPRDPRANRAPDPTRDQPRDQSADQRGGQRPDQRSARMPQRDSRPQNPERQSRPQSQPAQSQPRSDHADKGDKGSANSSFADNVPAFLQRAVRPVKAVSD